MSRPVKRAELFTPTGEGTLRCLVCARRCHLRPGQIGGCAVHSNQDGALILNTYGRVVAASLDPIEKKPLRHFRPGSRVYTVATPGCTLACRFCQNWEIALAVDQIRLEEVPQHTPAQVVEAAIAAGADGIGFSYTEPVAGLDFALDVMEEARRVGLYTVWHTNGYMTPESVAAALPWLDAACVDLKAPNDEGYRRLTGGALAPVLETASTFVSNGVWVEVSTPLLAGINDDAQSVRALAYLIRDHLGAGTPWHLLRGHAAWRMKQLGLTPSAVLSYARQLACEEGLEQVYIYP